MHVKNTYYLKWISWKCIGLDIKLWRAWIFKFKWWKWYWLLLLRRFPERHLRFRVQFHHQELKWQCGPESNECDYTHGDGLENRFILIETAPFKLKPSHYPTNPNDQGIGLTYLDQRLLKIDMKKFYFFHIAETDGKCFHIIDWLNAVCFATAIQFSWTEHSITVRYM